MFIGLKIKNITKARGLLIKTLAEKWGIEKHHFSRIVREKLALNDKKVAIAAEFLGVTPEYLRDESRPFNKGDKLPEDVIVRATTPEPAPPAPDPSDAATILARTQEAMVSKWPEVLRAVVRAEMEKMMLEIIELRATVERLDKKSNQP